MNTSSAIPDVDTPKSGILQRLIRNQFLKKLSNLQHGRMELKEQGESQSLGTSHGPSFGTLTVDNPDFYSKLAVNGSAQQNPTWTAIGTRSSWSTSCAC